MSLNVFEGQHERSKNVGVVHIQGHIIVIDCKVPFKVILHKKVW